MASPTEIVAVGRDYCAVSERARTARSRQYQRSGLAACEDTRGLSRVRSTIVAMRKADHDDLAKGMSTFGNAG